MAQRLGKPIISMLVQPNGVNVPNAKLTNAKWFTVHETANRNVGADARFHQRFVAIEQGGVNHVSFTYTADDKEIIQILPEDQAQYAQGTSEGNRTSVSCELCVNRDSDTGAARENVARLAAAWCVSHSRPLSAVRQHNSWTGKDCPAILRAEPGAWDRFIGRVGYYMAIIMPHPDQGQILHVDMNARRRQSVDTIGAPSCSRSDFMALMQKVQSPATPEAGDMYDTAVTHYRDPLALYYQFGRESHWGTDPNTLTVRCDLKNPGNLREPSTWDPGPHSVACGFMRFSSWSDGWRAMCNLYGIPIYQDPTKHDPPYTNDIWGRIKIWAPVKDGNDPVAYADYIVTNVNLFRWTHGSFDYFNAAA
jgi:hypothetical protein